MSDLFCHDPGLYHPSAQERQEAALAVAADLSPSAQVLIMFDGARSAAASPFFLSNPANMTPLREEGAVLTFRYAEEAAEYARRAGLIPVDCTPDDIKGKVFCRIVDTAIAHNEALEADGGWR